MSNDNNSTPQRDPNTSGVVGGVVFVIIVVVLMAIASHFMG